MSDPYDHIWENYLKDNYFPTFLRNVREISFDEFQYIVLNDKLKCESMIMDFLHGDVFIVKGVIRSETARQIKNSVYAYGKDTLEANLKADSCIPNYHSQSAGGTIKDGYKEFARSYFFWRWNKDELKIFEKIDKFWNIIKIFNGLGVDGLKNNVPADKIIDRIQVLHYPVNAGSISPHCDVARWQKTNVAISLTEVGNDYEAGGLYCLDKNEERVGIEHMISTGDSIVWLPSIFHGVEQPTTQATGINWSNSEGRWQLLAQGIQSWCVQNRVVSSSYQNFKKDPSKVLNDYVFRGGLDN